MVSCTNYRDCVVLIAGLPISAGLLYYSQLDSILSVEARPNEIRALIMTRNELASWLSRRRLSRADSATSSPTPASIRDLEENFLPAGIDDAKECGNCYAVDTCMLYQKVRRPPPPPPRGVASSADI